MQETPEFLIIGKITAPRGIRGEVKVEIWTDFPERFTEMETVYIGGDEGEANYPPRLFEVERARPHKKHILLKLGGVDTRNDAEEFRQQFLYVSTEETEPLSSEEYYVHQIIGLRVLTDEGEQLGAVSDVWPTGSNDVYVVEREGKPLLIPATKEVVREINLKEDCIIVKLLDGLL